MKYGVRAKDIMARNPTFVSSDTRLLSAIKKMAEKRIGGMLVVDKGKLVGILTEGDVLRRVLSKGLSTKKTRIGDIMTKNPVTVNSDDDLRKISKVMNDNKIGRVPVLENGKIVGYISEKDILGVSPGLMDILIEKLKILQPSSRFRFRRE
jgi:CBS domain-containing protein